MLELLFTNANLSSALPAIPRLLTALSEWFSCLLMVLVLPKRFPRLQTCLLLAGALVIQSILRCCYFGGYTLFSFLGLMVLNLLFMLAVIYTCCKLPLLSQLAAWMLAFLVAEFTASLTWQVCAVFFSAPSMAQPRVMCLLLLLFALVGLPIYYLGRHFSEEILYTDRKTLFLMCTVTPLAFLISNLYVVFRQDIWVNNNRTDVFFAVSWLRLLADLCGIIVLFSLLNISKLRRLETDMIITNKMMDAQYRQYLSFRSTSTYISQQCHDLKHQIAALRTSCSSEERENYLSEMEEVINSYPLYANTGNPVLDTLITQKQFYCKEHQIQFSYSVDSRLLSWIEPRELCILFGNLIDNALESVLQISDPERRQILLEVKSQRQLLSIRMDNCCDHPVEFQGGLPRTTKEDRQQHGYGMKSISRVISRYDGSLDCSLENGWFVTTVLLPLPDQP